MKKAKCFISYCVSDIEPNYVKIIVEMLKKIADKENYVVEFLFDRDLKIGEDLNKFMCEISIVDTIIMLCGPDYKKRSEDEKLKHTGVYKECNLMKQRLQKIKKCDENNESIEDINFKIFPLVVKQDDSKKNENSIPTFVSNIFYKNIELITFSNNNNKISISNSSIKKFKKIFSDCIAMTAVIHAEKSEYLDMSIEEKISKLVYNRKAEQIPTLDPKIFVKTFFYDKIKNQTAYILIGRKGSGKTTTKDYFYNQNRNIYKGKIELNINNIGLDSIYNYLYHGPYDDNISLREIKEDLTEIFTIERLIKFTWITYIYVYSMYIVSCEFYNNKENLSNLQNRCFKKVYLKLDEILDKFDKKERWKNTKDISPILYKYALTNTYRYFDYTIENTRDIEEYFISDIEAQLNVNALLQHVLSRELLRNFEKGLKECTKKILFTVDGFDTAAELFRKQALNSNPEEYKRKANFEIRWMLLLLEMILEIKSDCSNILFSNIDMCVSIPKDKFIEIQAINRDKYQYGDKICGIEWSGVELTIMLRKRLEEFSNYPLNKLQKKEVKCEDILDKILMESFPDIPRELTIVTKKGREYKMHIFLYMLRYSFWRPRDILTSLSSILKLYYGKRNSKTPINEKTIKAAIKLSSDTIVSSEFINEYSTAWVDIKTNIELFKGKNIILDISEIEEIVLSKKFNLLLESENRKIIEFKEIVSFLFEIGFIGIFVDNIYKEKYQMEINQGFVFYEGMNCLNGFINDDFDNCRFIINPVFANWLNLIIDTEELIGISDWNVLYELENSVRLKMLTEPFGI